jgi:hypothetical protein
MSSSDIRLVVFLVSLGFLFSGDPDLFDKIRAASLRYFDGVCN